jgi:hypothetical protein
VTVNAEKLKQMATAFGQSVLINMLIRKIVYENWLRSFGIQIMRLRLAL